MTRVRPILTLMACAVAGGCGGEAAFAPPPAPEVFVAAPESREITPSWVLPGRVEAVERVQVRARVAGFLQERRFEAGDFVEAGDVLFVIERAPFEAAAEAARARVAQAEASAELAAVTHANTERAAEQGAVNEFELRRTKAELDRAGGVLAEARAALRSAELDLSYTEVRAPSAGRVSKSEVDLGNLVGAGDATLLATIMQDDRVHVFFEVSEREVIAYIRRSGRPRDDSRRGTVEVGVELADGSALDQTGFVNYVDSEIDAGTGTLGVRGTIDNPDGLLFSGMFVRVRVPQPPRGALLVPETAVLRDLGGAYVLTAGDDGVVARTNVEVGIAIGGMREVTAGLSGGERVIVGGVQRARVGAPVRVAESAG